jgi:dTDP-4-amino-4,6-dideoxygalactose transaminase
MENPPKIPLLSPRLPTYDKIVPYLKKIDENRWYTNWGPLTKELEQRLASHFKVEKDQIIAVANGTEALTLGLLCMDRPMSARYCLVPSWTFAATPLAAVHAGLTPVFIDIDEGQWMTNPRTAHKAIAELRLRDGEIHSLMAVSPFGAPVDMAEWAGFEKETGIPVLVDAAASFDVLARVDVFYPSSLPVMVSLHATKAFGAGEGALLISKDRDYVLKARKMTNFGFGPARESEVLGKNGKISEYGSAVGLAELDGWPVKRAEWESCTRDYLSFGDRFRQKGVQFMPGYGNGWISSYCNVAFPSEVEKRLARKALADVNIETREWWGMGCHTHPSMKHFPKAELSETSVLSSQVVGLPFFAGLNRGQVERVADVLEAALKTK